MVGTSNADVTWWIDEYQEIDNSTYLELSTTTYSSDDSGKIVIYIL